jgi:hypothetical protein
MVMRPGWQTLKISSSRGAIEQFVEPEGIVLGDAGQNVVSDVWPAPFDLMREG